MQYHLNSDQQSASDDSCNMESDRFEDNKPPNKINNPNSSNNRLEVSDLELVDCPSINGGILPNPTEPKPQTFLINAKMNGDILSKPTEPKPQTFLIDAKM